MKWNKLFNMYSYIVKVKIDPFRVEAKDSLGKTFIKGALDNQFQGHTKNFEILSEEDFSVIVLVEYETIQEADKLLTDLEQLKKRIAGVYSGIEVFVVTNRLSM